MAGGPAGLGGPGSLARLTTVSPEFPAAVVVTAVSAPAMLVVVDAESSLPPPPQPTKPTAITVRTDRRYRPNGPLRALTFRSGVERVVQEQYLRAPPAARDVAGQLPFSREPAILGSEDDWDRPGALRSPALWLPIPTSTPARVRGATNVRIGRAAARVFMVRRLSSRPSSAVRPSSLLSSKAPSTPPSRCSGSMLSSLARPGSEIVRADSHKNSLVVVLSGTAWLSHVVAGDRPGTHRWSRPRPTSSSGRCRIDFRRLSGSPRSAVSRRRSERCLPSGRREGGLHP